MKLCFAAVATLVVVATAGVASADPPKTVAGNTGITGGISGINNKVPSSVSRPSSDRPAPQALKQYNLDTHRLNGPPIVLPGKVAQEQHMLDTHRLNGPPLIVDAHGKVVPVTKVNMNATATAPAPAKAAPPAAAAPKPVLITTTRGPDGKWRVIAKPVDAAKPKS